MSLSYRRGLSARYTSDPVSWSDRVAFEAWCKKNGLTTGQALCRFILATGAKVPSECLPKLGADTE